MKPYLTNGDEIEFDIADDADTQPLTVVRISDERATGSASIVKRCADDSCPWCEEGNAVEGARFIVVAMEDILNPTPIPFTLNWVNAETPVVDIEVTHQNAPTETVIHKTDASTGAPLAGASFDVWPRQLMERGGKRSRRRAH